MQARQTKTGLRLFPPEKPRIWEVGKKLGVQLRESKQEEYKQTHLKAPHLRCAHWHGYWTGPKDSERKFIYKWLPPTFVGSQ